MHECGCSAERECQCNAVRLPCGVCKPCKLNAQRLHSTGMEGSLRCEAVNEPEFDIATIAGHAVTYRREVARLPPGWAPAGGSRYFVRRAIVRRIVVAELARIAGAWAAIEATLWPLETELARCEDRHEQSVVDGEVMVDSAMFHSAMMVRVSAPLLASHLLPQLAAPRREMVALDARRAALLALFTAAVALALQRAFRGARGRARYAARCAYMHFMYGPPIRHMQTAMRRVTGVQVHRDQGGRRAAGGGPGHPAHRARAQRARAGAAGSLRCRAAGGSSAAHPGARAGLRGAGARGDPAAARGGGAGRPHPRRGGDPAALARARGPRGTR